MDRNGSGQESATTDASIGPCVQSCRVPFEDEPDLGVRLVLPRTTDFPAQWTTIVSGSAVVPSPKLALNVYGPV